MGRADGSALKEVSAEFVFKLGSDEIRLMYDIASKNGSFEIAGDALTKFVGGLVNGLVRFSPINEPKIPASIESASITFTPKSPKMEGKPTHAVQKVDVKNRLRFEFIRQIQWKSGE